MEFAPPQLERSQDGSSARHRSEGAAYTPQDIRFTAKGNVVYAITLGVPAGQVAIESLGKRAGYAGGPIRTVHLLGSKAALKWTQSDDALGHAAGKPSHGARGRPEDRVVGAVEESER